MDKKLNNIKYLSTFTDVLAYCGDLYGTATDPPKPAEGVSVISEAPIEEPAPPLDEVGPVNDEPEVPIALEEIEETASPLAVLARPPLAALLASKTDVVQSYISQLSSAATRKTMVQGLERCARMLDMPFERVPWEELRFEHTAHIRGRLLEPENHYETSSVRVTLAALRGVLKHAWRMGRIPGEDFYRAIDWNKLPQRDPPLKGRELTQAELDTLRAYWTACSEDEIPAYGAFLGATFALLMGAALRASEVCRMTIPAYNSVTGLVWVVRKGGRKEQVPLGVREMELLDAWLVVRAEYPKRRIKTDALLLRVQKNGWVRPATAALNVKSLEHLCLIVAKDAGIARFTPHDLRRTFATRTPRMGIAPYTVQRLMGHQDPATTERYNMTRLEELTRIRRGFDAWT